MGIVEINNNHTQRFQKTMKRHLTILAITAAAFAATSSLNATVLNLGSSGSGTVAGAYFATTDQQPTGTGVFDPFMTIQNSPWEQGYNSGTGNFDTKREPQWNHEIRVSDLRATSIGGIDYYGFTVDINEPGGGKALISLDGLKLFTSSTIQTSQSVDGNGFFNGSLGTLRFDLGANSVRYDDKQSGSGSGDLDIFIPVSNFAGAGQNDYVYMYQLWGNTDITEGGFEETAIKQGFVPIPEVSPASVIFGFLGLVVAVSSRRALNGRLRALATRSIK
jgi:hypothetical protein